MKMVSLKIYNGVAWLVKIESAYVIFFPFSDGKQPPFFTIFTILLSEFIEIIIAGYFA